MKIKRKQRFNEACVKGGLISIIALMLMGCASTPKPMQFKPEVIGPQIIVEPASIRLGIAKLIDTKMVISGEGFHPGDSVFIDLIGEKEGENIDIPIDVGDVDEEGRFAAEVSKTVKATEFLRLDFVYEHEIKGLVPVIARPPIPEGVYTVKAASVESGKVAECPLVVQGPSYGDSFKDWLGVMLGKIRRK